MAKRQQSLEEPAMLYANEKGEIFDHPYLKLSVRTANFDFLASPKEYIPLPKTSRLYFMQDTHPIGYDERYNRNEVFNSGMAVSAFLDPGFLRLYLPSYEKVKDYIMPLYAYCPVGFLDGEFVVPAIQVDDTSRWDPSLYDFSCEFDNRVDAFLKEHPNNRLYNQLKICATKYHCTASKNVFYGRWECPIPTSPACNARCVGCISLQDEGSCLSPQERLSFIPEAREIAEVAINHIASAGVEDSIISFGQGCEGDPILAATTIAEATKLIKKEFPNVTVNFNSNSSIADNIKLLIDSGVDSFRISLNSTNEETYLKYYRPRSYTFKDVCQSAELIKNAGRYLQLNLLTFPGVNDRKSEVDALIHFVKEYNVNMIQMRNLNIDAELYLSKLALKPEDILGLKNMMKLLKKEKKDIQFGYFNRPRNKFFESSGYPKLNK